MSNRQLKYGILFTLLALVVGLMLFGDNSGDKNANSTPMVTLTPSIPTVTPTPTLPPPPVPAKVAVCNYAANPIWDGVFKQQNLQTMPESELANWRVLDNARAGIVSDEDLLAYVRAILSQMSYSDASTPFGVVGAWLSAHQQDLALEIVTEFPSKDANAAFTIRQDGSSAMQIKRSFLTTQFALSVGFTLAHESTHASYYFANNTMLPPTDFCGEYQQYSVAMASYLSVHTAFQDANYDVWLTAADTPYWWLKNKWVTAIETHMNQVSP